MSLIYINQFNRNSLYQNTLGFSDGSGQAVQMENTTCPAMGNCRASTPIAGQFPIALQFSRPTQNISIYLFLIIALMPIFSCQTKPQAPPVPTQIKNEILASHIADQWTYEGARLNIYIHAIAEDLSGIKYNLINAPDFIKIKTNKGEAEIIVDATKGTTGRYDIYMQIKNGNKTTDRNFNILIKKPKAEIYYSDAANGDDNNPGTYKKPWKSLQNINLQKNKSSEILLLLKPGHYQNNDFNKLDFNKINIMPAAGGNAKLGAFTFSESENIILKSLTIEPKSICPQTAFVEIKNNCQNIEISNCKIQAAENYDNWGNPNWKEKIKSGIFTWGKNILIKNNLLRNVFHGMEINGDVCLIDHNIVDRFGGDAIRNTGSNNAFDFNTLKNAVVDDYYDEGGNHDDLFQAWTFDEPVEYVRISNNIGVAYADNDLLFPSKIVQGLVNFDGFSENWLIENNLVLTDHPHGIALLGAKDCNIINNTVARNPRRDHDFESPPWIMIADHKDGRPSSGNMVQNNLTSALRITENAATADHNVVMDSTYSRYFVDYPGWDFHLKKGSGCIDAGSAFFSPKKDLDGKKRPAEEGADVGCYEL
ncbi:MAG TPA: hypothetical protein ENJ95_20015 [Bacteroidetes bacterium]|nr:hypothetical protein [Bacteroidota bacterium]